MGTRQNSQTARGEKWDGGTRIAFAETTASVRLDFIRGIAALAVLVDHWRNALFLDYGQVPISPWWKAAPYLLTSGGHQAVVVFFVLSGYLVGGSILRAVGQRSWSWRVYLLHRFVRLWIVLFPGLVLCEVWDHVGIWLNRAPLLYGGANYNHLTLPVLPRLGVVTFVGNLFFLGGLRVPTLGSDGPLWSLGFEFWYYLLFPALLFLALDRRWAIRIVLFALAIVTAWIGGPAVLGEFPIWLLGVCLAAAPHLPTMQRWARWTYAAFYAPAFFVFSKVHIFPGPTGDYLLGIMTAVLLVAILSAKRRVQEQRLFSRASRWLASLSFTLYVAHLPFLLLLLSMGARDRRWLPEGRMLWLGLGVLGLVLAYAWGLAVVTEFRTAYVRQWLEQRLPGFAPQNQHSD